LAALKMPLEHKRFFRIGKLFFWIPTAAALAHSLRRARIISHGEFDSQNFRHSTNSDRFADIRKASLRASNRLMHCNKIGNFKKIAASRRSTDIQSIGQAAAIAAAFLRFLRQPSIPAKPKTVT
jgi:hypothetical protein